MNDQSSQTANPRLVLVSTMILLPAILSGCGQDPVAVAMPELTVEAPAELQDQGQTWVKADISSADQDCLTDFFRQNQQLVGSPDMEGEPVLFTSGKNDRRFYWLSSTIDGSRWICVHFEKRLFHDHRRNGQPVLKSTLPVFIQQHLTKRTDSMAWSIQQYATRFGLIATSCIIAMNCRSAVAETIRTKTVTRIFWQDRDTDKLSYADITASDKWGIKRGWVAGFPKLDAEKQDLVQMKANNGMLVVGVRDHDDGSFQSGWVSIDTGVFEEPHGNHSHWKYTATPKVTGQQLNTDQGNPAASVCLRQQFLSGQ